MSKITKFDKQNLNVVRDVIEKALKEAGVDIGVTFRTGNCTYGDAECKFQLSVRVADPKAQENAKKESFNRYCRSFGLRPEDYGTTITTAGKRLTLIGILPKKIKYPFEMKDENDKVMLYTDAVVERIKATTDAAKK